MVKQKMVETVRQRLRQTVTVSRKQSNLRELEAELPERTG